MKSNLLVEILIYLMQVYCYLLILRAWFQYARVDYYNPIVQLVIKFTEPVAWLRKLLPRSQRIDLAPLLVAFILAAAKLPIIALLNGIPFVFDLDLILISALIGALSVVKFFGKILFWIIILRAIFSWFRQATVLERLLMELSEPILARIRNFLPQTGMIDFSVTVLAFGIIIIDNVLIRYMPYWGFI